MSLRGILIETKDSAINTASDDHHQKPKKKKKDLMVIDCFPYNGEHIVTARLAMLNPYVDLFFISEPTFTFSGIQKERLYKDINADIFLPYKDKIIWINDTDLKDSTRKNNAWAREEAQRNAGVSAFHKAIDDGQLSQPFIVIHTDVDEIPNPSILEQITIPATTANATTTNTTHSLYNESLRQALYLSMDMFYYNFNWLKGRGWALGSLVHSTLIMEQRQSLHRIRESKNKMRYTVDDGGWHCSYCMSTNDIINKLHAFSHQEFNIYPYNSRAHIQDCIPNGKDLFNRTTKTFSSYHNFTQLLPQELQEFNKELVLSQLA